MSKWTTDNIVNVINNGAKTEEELYIKQLLDSYIGKKITAILEPLSIQMGEIGEETERNSQLYASIIKALVSRHNEPAPSEMMTIGRDSFVHTFSINLDGRGNHPHSIKVESIIYNSSTEYYHFDFIRATGITFGLNDDYFSMNADGAPVIKNSDIRLLTHGIKIDRDDIILSNMTYIDISVHSNNSTPGKVKFIIGLKRAEVARDSYHGHRLPSEMIYHSFNVQKKGI